MQVSSAGGSGQQTGAAAPVETTPAAAGVRRVPVALARGGYEVVIGSHCRHAVGQELLKLGCSAGTRVLVVSNPVVFGHYGSAVMASLTAAGFRPSRLVVDAGEQQKTVATVAQIHDACFAARLERGSLILALGGGVVGDMAGFAAATWLRGIAVVQVPTTLLAMVDAAIGGKTGVNHPGGKNLIGAFHQPGLVLVDPETLHTLPEREFRAGMAEVIKYGVIGDRPLFLALEQADRLDTVAGVGATLLTQLLQRSVRAKAEVVADDEREQGRRAILNYGHTLGHAVETLCGYGHYLHGEAVALGMHAVGWLACQAGYWHRDDQQRQAALIAKAGLPLVWPALEADAVLQCISSDKKVRQGKVRFVVPTAIGSVHIRDDLDPDLVRQAVRRLAG